MPTVRQEQLAEEKKNAWNQSASNPLVDWLWRVLKGFIIGVGAIVPGLSGGVMMVVFGIYDRLLAFLAHIRQRFIEQMRYFIPIGIGGLLGIFLFSVLIEKAFGRYEALFVTLFIAFVVGTIPSLNRSACKKGRGLPEYIALIVASLVIFALMMMGEREFTDVAPNIPIWIGSGVLVGLGFIVPGLSPSNFLMYFGLYQKMADGIKRLDFGVIIPIGLGVLLAVLLFSKLVHWLFQHYYGVMYHIILGTVIGSSLAIFPTHVFPAFTAAGQQKTGMNFPFTLLAVVVMFGLGLGASLAFARFEAKYRPED